MGVVLVVAGTRVAVSGAAISLIASVIASDSELSSERRGWWGAVSKSDEPLVEWDAVCVSERQKFVDAARRVIGGMVLDGIELERAGVGGWGAQWPKLVRLNDEDGSVARFIALLESAWGLERA